MNKKIFFGVLALLCGLAFTTTSCNDDKDYSEATGTLIKEGAVVTGSSDVTATTATMYGSVTGLDNVSASSYTVGFFYGPSADALTGKISGSTATSFSATLEGLSDATTLYYQAYVTLQGRVTYKGGVQSFTTTDAVITTGDARVSDAFTATLSSSFSGYPEGATTGYVISTSSDVETLRAAYQVLNVKATGSDLSQSLAVFQPGTTYYYAAYMNIGSGIVFGNVKSFSTPAKSYDANEDFVDLGLSVKWAKTNVAAPDEFAAGGLFAFGDLDGWKASIDPADYNAADTYKTAQDIVYKNYGGIATLPTADQFEELFRLCTVEYVGGGEAPYYKVTGPNGNFINLPVSGKRFGQEIEEGDYKAYYATGTVNASNPQYYVDYEISEVGNGRNTLPVYTAVAVRAVTSAKNVALAKSMLYNTWEIDIKDDGTTSMWAGPVFFYGTADSWHTLTNGEPVIGDCWAWEADASNSWAWDGTDGCKGSMTFYNVDGKDSVSVTKIAKDGTSTTQTGALFIDEANYTLTSDVDLLVPTNFIDGYVSDRKTNIKIMQQSDKTLQLGFFRDGDPCTLGVNYVPQSAKYGLDVTWLGVGSDWGGTWGSVLGSLMPAELEGDHTFTYLGAQNGAMVNTLDFKGLLALYPNAIVTVKDIKLDGNSIQFDANNFCYGDIENNGNYRIELFNIWGKGAANGNVVASPFSNQKDVASDAAFTYATSFEITVHIALEGAATVYTPNLITINPSWGGTWGYNDGSTFQVAINNETGKIDVNRKDFDIFFSDPNTDFTAGSIMTFIEIQQLYATFPGVHFTLNDIKLDGSSLTGWDASKVLDVNGDGDGQKYRLELWNCYGETGSKGCAFGTRDGDVIHELGFTTSMEVNFSLSGLFATPEW